MDYGAKTIDAFKQAFTSFDDSKISEGKWGCFVIRLCIGFLFVWNALCLNIFRDGQLVVSLRSEPRMQSHP